MLEVYNYNLQQNSSKITVWFQFTPRWQRRTKANKTEITPVLTFTERSTWIWIYIYIIYIDIHYKIVFSPCSSSPQRLTTSNQHRHTKRCLVTIYTYHSSYLPDAVYNTVNTCFHPTRTRYQGTTMRHAEGSLSHGSRIEFWRAPRLESWSPSSPGNCCVSLIVPVAEGFLSPLQLLYLRKTSVLYPPSRNHQE